MKPTPIAEIRLEVLELATRPAVLDEPLLPCVLLTLGTADGVVGVGEAVPGVAYTGETIDTVVATIAGLAPDLLDDDFRGDRLAGPWASLGDGSQAARGAVDTALWDLEARVRGVTLTDLLGGAVRGPFPETFPFDRQESPEAATATTRTLVGQGVHVFKVYLGTGSSPVLDPARYDVVAAVREAGGADIEIRVDANGGWRNGPEAVAAIRRLEASAISFVEEPVQPGDLTTCRWIRDRVSVPICLDESVRDEADARAAIRASACDRVSIKLMKTGGLLEARRLADAASAAGIGVHVGNMGHTSVGVAAILHLAASLPEVASVDTDPPWRGGGLRDDIATGLESRRVAGQSVLFSPTDPGLGVRIDQAAVAKQRTRAVVRTRRKRGS